MSLRCLSIMDFLISPAGRPLKEIKKSMIDKHLKLIDQAAKKKAKILCLQELFYGPYFCAEQETKWYALTERVPEGPTTRRFAEIARKYGYFATWMPKPFGNRTGSGAHRPRNLQKARRRFAASRQHRGPGTSARSIARPRLPLVYRDALLAPDQRGCSAGGRRLEARQHRLPAALPAIVDDDDHVLAR